MKKKIEYKTLEIFRPKITEQIFVQSQINKEKTLKYIDFSEFVSMLTASVTTRKPQVRGANFIGELTYCKVKGRWEIICSQRKLTVATIGSRTTLKGTRHALHKTLK